MENIKLLLGHSDRRSSNQVEVAVLDVCYDRATVHSTRTARLDEFLHQGSVRDFDLIVVGADHLFQDRTQQRWAKPEAVISAITNIRLKTTTPIVAFALSPASCDALLQAGADAVLSYPLDTEQLKTELRALLDLNELVEVEDSNRWPSLGSLIRSFQKIKVAG
jgi:hypothetical protein